MSRDCDAHSRMSEEFRRLAEALAERAGSAGQRDVSPTCTWCPVCAVVGLLRGERPELAARLAEHGAGLLAVLREVVAAPSDASADGSATPPQGPRVQHVRVQRSGSGSGSGSGEDGGAGC